MGDDESGEVAERRDERAFVRRDFDEEVEMVLR